MSETVRGKPEKAEMSVRILYYPFMGTDIDTERLILLARLCYAPMGIDELEDLLTGDKPSKEDTGKFIRNLIRSGHLGALEHWHTTFAVEGYSRISSQQNDRHRLMKVFKDSGVFYYNEPVQASADVSQLQQSQRYVKEDNFRYITPPSFYEHPEFLKRFETLQDEVLDMQRQGLSLGIPAEDVRFALTNATETRFVVTTNARQLRHMFNLRCCQRAQWEIREMFTRLLEQYKEIAPNIFYKAGASCDEFGYCPEGKMSCGRAPTLDELKKAYKTSKKEKKEG
ncbi:MAG TPA: FAD-dependent thymidylate synthase [Bacillota bacterium]|nr:FAD-dependent thymidylate synthase [Candidatus Fermentithermobacillaceae bacterium]HOB30980.1 FAD-dependent thymidylate synthase [Bacillota bacterium]HOK64775.1 FAD-dependent thymidylate synthase [Bacillota bacterium]HOL12312.1 FAD-dependent thymidylate synthase [Bacillota bacterium]HOQ03520.1 FAD-dependent thymidylate synthase [Bacillota bacterium]